MRPCEKEQELCIEVWGQFNVEIGYQLKFFLGCWNFSVHLLCSCMLIVLLTSSRESYWTTLCVHHLLTTPLPHPSHQTLQIWLLFMALLGLSTALVCPDGGVCEERNTCCQNTEGGYGCCPLPNVSFSVSRPCDWGRRSSTKSCLFDPFLQADCCSDHLHCCYEGTVCDLAHSKCVNKTVSLPWVSRLPARQTPSAPQVDSHLFSLFTVITTVC